MSLVENIEVELKLALKDKATAKVSTLRMLKSAFKNQAIELKKTALDDEEALIIIKRELKKRQDSIAQFQAGKREDLAATEQAEVDILSVYLPPALSEADVQAVIDEIIATGVNNFGQAMKMTMAKLGAQADGQVVQKLVKAKLGL